MASQKQRFLLWLFMTLLWMLVIYRNSNQPYHEQDIKPMLATLVSPSRLEQFLPHMKFYYDGALIQSASPYELIEFFLRKAAHMSEYALLTFLCIRTLLTRPLNKNTALLLGGFIAILYAATDELHQIFVPGRTGHFIDVIVDSVGVLFMVTLFYIFKRKTR
jgi:VanZ family protein